jgi:hypothetical protein
MSIFTDILERLGLRKPQPAATAGPPSRPKPSTGPSRPATGPSRPAYPAPRNPPQRPKPVEMVDVYDKLEKMAAKSGVPSNWKTSIADLLFLLGLDHSYAARKELARELGYPADEMDDSFKMNSWLHKTVLKKIAENGGRIPKEMLD